MIYKLKMFELYSQEEFIIIFKKMQAFQQCFHENFTCSFIRLVSCYNDLNLRRTDYERKDNTYL